MAAVLIVDSRVNPSDPTQRVDLWGNGRIDTYNTPPITDGPSDWYDRLDLPVAVAIWIINWTTMAGYVLDGNGGVRRFNGAPEIATSKPEWYDGPNMIVPGIPYWPTKIFVDWSFSPYQPGFGYALDGYGTIHNFGGAVQAPRWNNRWNQPTIARKLVVDWIGLKAYTLDYSGGIHADFNAAAPPAAIPYWRGQDVARDLVITDWGSAPKGYTLDKYGAAHAWGGAQSAFGGPYNTGGDWARKLHVIKATDPLTLQVVGSWAQEHTWRASTKPNVVAGGLGPSPADTVTNTTRPSLNWTYTDAQRDSQSEVQVLVFTQAYVNSNLMTDPLLHAERAVVDVATNDPDTRGIVPRYDFPNGQYRMYVRAKDSADQYSDWSNKAWTQNVPVPATPTGLTAVPDHELAIVNLSVKRPTSGTIAPFIRFEYSDDGSSWWTVRGAGAVPLDAATVRAIDLDIPQGPDRTYRAVAYSVDPRTASAPSNTQTTSIETREHILTAVNDVALGGIIRVIEPPDWSRPVTVGVFEGLGAEYPVVVSDGAPKARRIKLTAEANGRAEWDKLVGLLESNSVLVHRDPFGSVAYCRLAGDWTRTQRLVAPLPGEDTPWRHNHVVDISLVEVRPPHWAA